jgi:hypothetical protein
MEQAVVAVPLFQDAVRQFALSFGEPMPQTAGAHVWLARAHSIRIVP